MKRFKPYIDQILPFCAMLIIIYACSGIFIRMLFKFQNLFFSDLIVTGLVSILWLLAIYVIMGNREVSVEYVVDKLHGRKREMYKFVLDIISGLCCLLLALSGLVLIYKLMKLELKISTVFPIPQWVPVLFFVVGMIGCCVAFFFRAINLGKGRNKC